MKKKCVANNNRADAGYVYFFNPLCVLFKKFRLLPLFLLVYENGY